MRLYAVADIHGKKEVLARIGKNINQYRPDILIIAGDITHYFYPQDTIDHIRNYRIPVLTVRGNSDFPIVDRLIAKTSTIHSIHGRSFTESGFHFIGMNGALLLPFRTRVCFREAKRFRTIESEPADKSILVMHPPPYGFLDRVMGKIHAGSRNIYRFIVQKQPLLFLCGHIHEDIGQMIIGETTVVNCSLGKAGDGAIIQLEANRKPKVDFIG